MNRINLRVTIVFLFAFLTFFAFSQNNASIDKLKENANQFILEWHKNAADADLDYFDKIAEDGIYIGTDPTELWTKDEFFNWSKKYFDNGKAWSFTTISRNIYLGDNKSYVWFDELLNTGMGVCRASGILRKKDNGWEIIHYHLSMSIPNESVSDIKKIIEGS